MQQYAANIGAQRESSEGFFGPGIEVLKIAENENKCPGGKDSLQPFQSVSKRETRAAVLFRGRVGNASQELVELCGAACWPNLTGAVDAHDDAAHAVARIFRRPRQRRRGASRLHRFESATGTEAHARALIDQEIDRSLTFFFKELGVYPTGARGHPPVNGANIVAGLIEACFIELHAAAAKI